MVDALLTIATALIVIFSIFFACYITFLKTDIQSLVLKIVLAAFLSVCIFLLTSVTTLLIVWPPM